MGKARSDIHHIKREIPQGSVLGPILFLLYINDLPNQFELDTKTVIYADDSVVTASIDSLSLETITKADR